MANRWRIRFAMWLYRRGWVPFRVVVREISREQVSDR